jgi:hypothetical protein
MFLEFVKNKKYILFHVFLDFTTILFVLWILGLQIQKYKKLMFFLKKIKKITITSTTKIVKNFSIYKIFFNKRAKVYFFHHPKPFLIIHVDSTPFFNNSMLVFYRVSNFSFSNKKIEHIDFFNMFFHIKQIPKYK